MQYLSTILVLLLMAAAGQAQNSRTPQETSEQHNVRMAWWREARFGMFIHWGVYSIPARGEWYMSQEKVSVEKYEQYPPQFNPVGFDARAWVRLAKRAGMKYVVITSKHHDGFCMFDSKVSSYDIIDRTPFKRDPLKELAAACREEGIRLCFYHSILDWHHPDAKGASFPRYREEYLKPQLKELLTGYGPIGVLWFDGDWIPEWSEQEGKDLYRYVRSLQPGIIVNNRVGKGRNGMEGMNIDTDAAGDFGTPEQEIPANGIDGVDWESCMTMNDHWGYASADSNWKSAATLIRNLVDIASKGGNYLLNVGPTALGTIPGPSVERLEAIGRWMAANGEAIHGTKASPLATTPWGRCTEKKLASGATRLYLHVFEWPRDGNLAVSGLGTVPRQASMLGSGLRPLKMRANGDTVVLRLPSRPVDTVDAVVVLDFSDEPVTFLPPVVTCALPVFLDTTEVTMETRSPGLEIRYTLDGTQPSSGSPRFSGPLRIANSATVRARCFYHGNGVAAVTERTLTRAVPEPAVKISGTHPGLRYFYYEGSWDNLPDFDRLQAADSGMTGEIGLTMCKRDDNVGVRLTGFIDVPATGIFGFGLSSDDGSRLLVQGNVVVNNDGLHGAVEKLGVIALEKGLHPVDILYFNKTGEKELSVRFAQGLAPLAPIPGSLFVH
jgi:alpha-L-fucosidase